MMLKDTDHGNMKYNSGAVSICAEIKAADKLRRPLKPHMPVVVKTGHIDTNGRIVLVGKKQLNSGDVGYARLVLAEPVGIRCGMPFSLWDKSGGEIFAEGNVLIIGLPRVGTAKVDSVVSLLDKLSAGDRRGAMHDLVGFFSPKGVNGSFIREALSLTAAEFEGLLQGAAGIVEIKLGRDAVYMDEIDAKKWADKIIRLIKEYHINEPHQPGPDLPFIEGKLKPAPAKAVAREIIKRLKAEGLVVEDKGRFRMPEFSPRPEDPLGGVKGDALRLYREMGYSPAMLRDVAKTLKQPVKRLVGILRYLCDRGYLVRLDKETFIAKETFDKAKDLALAMIKHQGDIEAGEFRDRIGSSRRIATLLLERFDKKGWTERRGRIRISGSKHPTDGEAGVSGK